MRPAPPSLCRGGGVGRAGGSSWHRLRHAASRGSDGNACMNLKIDWSYAGAVRLVTAAIGVAMVLYHMWAIAFGSPEAVWFRGTHLLFAMVLTFLMFRLSGTRRGDADACRLRAACARRRAHPLSLHQLRLRGQPHLLRRRPLSQRQDHGLRHDRAAARGDAPRARLGAADHRDTLPQLRPVHRAARAAAPARSALHDHRGHLRHSAVGVGDLCADLRGVRHLHGAHRHRAIVHGFRHRLDRPSHRRSRQGGGGVVQSVRHYFRQRRRQRYGHRPDQHSLDEAHRLQAGFRRRGRSRGVDRRPDHAADHGRRRFRDGRVPRRLLRPGGDLGADPGRALLSRLFLGGAFRGQAARPYRPAAFGIAEARRRAAHQRPSVHSRSRSS